MAKTEAIVKLTESNEKALGEKRGCEIFIEEQRIEISRLQSEYAKISQ